MRSYGPKALLKVANGERLIHRQIRLIREEFDDPNIVVVAGFEAKRLQKHLAHLNVTLVTNENHEAMNIAESIRMGLAECSPLNPTLIVYGDMVFDRQALNLVGKPGRSCILVDETSGRRASEVGVSVHNDTVRRFSHGLQMKWASIALLFPAEMHLLAKVLKRPNRRNFAGYEILNEVIDLGGRFSYSYGEGLSLCEIDCSRDIAKASCIL